jgi:hypothetical protein
MGGDGWAFQSWIFTKVRFVPGKKVNPARLRDHVMATWPIMRMKVCVRAVFFGGRRDTFPPPRKGSPPEQSVGGFRRSPLSTSADLILRAEGLVQWAEWISPTG